MWHKLEYPENLFNSPSSAFFSSLGPPGYSNPRTLATLSYASPTASSKVVPIILIVVASFIVEKVFSDLWMNRQKALDSIYDITQESFVGIRVIKAFLKETTQLLHFSKAARKCEKSEVKMALYVQGYDVILDILIGLSTCLILGIGGYFVIASATGTPEKLFGATINLSTAELVTFLN